MIEIWGKPQCPYCEKAKLLCDMREVEFTYKQLDKDFTKEELFEVFPSARTFPQIRFIPENLSISLAREPTPKETYIGGFRDLEKILGSMLT